MKRPLHVAVGLLLSVWCLLVPVGAWALTSPPNKGIHLLITPLPTNRELFAIFTPCSPVRPAAVSLWVAADRNNGFRTYTLGSRNAMRAVLRQNRLLRLVTSLSLHTTCDRK